MNTARNSWRMGAEVSRVSSRLAAAVGCTPCGIGIAIDMVGKRWGDEPYDWNGSRFKHECTVTRDGLTDGQRRAVVDIERGLEEWARHQRGGEGHQPTLKDTRLPPERDDEVTQ